MNTMVETLTTLQAEAAPRTAGAPRGEIKLDPPDPPRRERTELTVDLRRPPLVPVTAPGAGAAEIDQAIATRRAEQDRLADSLLKIESKLTTTIPNRLRQLLTGKGGDDRAALREQAAKVHERLAVLDSEIAELVAARRPYDAHEQAYRYDREIRPALQKDLRELRIHLQAAADVLIAGQARHVAADQMRAASMVRNIAAERAGAAVVEIDGREIELLNRWRSILTAREGRLSYWLEELRRAGFLNL